MYCFFPRGEVLYHQLSKAVPCDTDAEKKEEILKVVSRAFGGRVMKAGRVKNWAKFVLLDSEKLPSVAFYNRNKRAIVQVLMAYKQQARL